jgi:hypothetical protein
MFDNIIPSIIAAVIISAVSTFVTIQIGLAKITERFAAFQQAQNEKYAEIAKKVDAEIGKLYEVDLLARSNAERCQTVKSSLDRAWERVDDHSKSIQDFGKQLAAITERLEQLKDVPRLVERIASRLDVTL